MDWITKAAKEREDRRIRREAIERDAPALWQEVCGTMEQAVRDYEEIAARPRQAKLSGRVAHAIHVAVFERRGQSLGMQVGRVAIVLDHKQNVVEIRTAVGGVPRKFPIGLNEDGRTCLTQEGREIPVEEFARVALYDVFFPKEDAASLDLED
jgi:hypothetical protein